MARRPTEIIYGSDDRPRGATLATLGFQHLLIASVGLIFPVILAVEADADPNQTQRLVQATLIAVGVATILQGLRKGPFGSGYLCPGVGTPVYFPASLLAIKSGGLSLLFGMLFFAGLVEALFSRLLPRLRALLPTEVTGVVVTMVGLWVIQISVSRFVGLSGEDTVSDVREVLVGGIALAVMCAFSVLRKGPWRLYCVVIGIGVGCVVSWLCGLTTVDDLAPLEAAPFLSAPGLVAMDWSFDIALAIPFGIAGLTAALKGAGDLSVCQKIDASDWRRPDFGTIGRGILADAAGTMSAGIFGGAGQATSTSNIGCAIATGAASRWIGFVAGGLTIMLAFFPKVAALVSIIPTPVMGAALMFAAAFMIVAGIQVICSRMLDTRKILVVGLALTMGLSADLGPHLYAGVPAWIAPVFSSSLSLTMVTAVVLNLLFRIGIATRRSFEFAPGADASATIADFIEASGAAWGARADVITRAMSIITEFAEAAADAELVQGVVSVEVVFDELNLHIELCYAGEPIMLPRDRPTPDEILDEGGLVRLSGYLVGQLADNLRMDVLDGRHRLRIRLMH